MPGDGRLPARPVVHFEIAGPDLDALTSFYRRAFGWDPSGDDQYRLVRPGGGVGGGIGGGLMRCHDGMPPYVTVYIAVDDLEATLAEVARLGGTTTVPPTPVQGFGAFALFEDPAGNVVGLMREDAPRPSSPTA